MTPEQEQAVAQWIGIPFVEHGRDETGVDCWGVPYMAYRQFFNIDLPHYNETYKDVTKESRDDIVNTINQQKKDDWHKTDSPKFGDVALFKIGGYGWHIGLILDEKRMIHVFRGGGTVVELYKSSKWESRLDGIYRHTTNL